MLRPISLAKRAFADYKTIIEPALYDEVLKLAGQLQGRRLLHVSSTAKNGGVAEILQSLAPLAGDLGLMVDWQVIDAPQSFFEITKMIHNGLQGDPHNLQLEQWQEYERINHELASELGNLDYDFVMIHDPQPAASIGFINNPAKYHTIWRYHGDSSHPNNTYLEPFLGYLKPYDAAIFSLGNYILPGYQPPHMSISPVAIDPLSAKNQPMNREEATQLVGKFGIATTRPLITQVSRFDPWKDPLGVIEAWKIARTDIPDLQLALVGNFASDDPQSAEVLSKVKSAAQGQANLFIVANEADERTTKAFQTFSIVILQKSLREGFGLTVSEALWSGTPVIGGNVGGIRLQIEDGKNGYLVDSVEETAARIVELVNNPEQARRMGEAGHELVRQKFLLPRLLRDDLHLLVELLAVPH